MMGSFAKKSVASRLGFLFALAAAIFFQLGNQLGGMACLGILMAVFIVHLLFKIFGGCITMISLCQSMRKTKDCSMTEWDDLLEV